MAHPSMANRLRAFVEAILPWFDVRAEALKDDRSRRRLARADIQQQRSERIIAEYRRATLIAQHAGERLADELRRR